MHPECSVAQTGDSVAKSWPIFRFTRRLYFSSTGAWKSQRKPILRLRLFFMRQSSFTNESTQEARKYLSAFPYAIELVAGKPSRKSARSFPVKAPVNTKLPRGFCCDN